MPLAAGVGTTQAWNAGIGYDIKSLVTLSRKRESARDAALQVDASLLWQEWQTIGQARMLTIDLIMGAQSMRQQTQVLETLVMRSADSQRALAAGNVTLSATAPDLAAVQAARSAIDDLERQQLSRRHQLAALLGLQPGARVPLAAQADLPPFDPAVAHGQLSTLAQRRPDLIALQFGYQAQDARFRTAILAQFPNLTLGVTGGSDNSNVRNIGPSITFELPLFDRNQGNIAIERATRQQLHDEYSARLAAAHGQVLGMLDEIAQITEQLAGKRRELPELRRNAERARTAFASGDLDARGYVDFLTTRFAKEQEILTLQQTLLDQQVAIAILIGAGMPDIHLPDPNGANGSTP